ncbi:MAG TPA: hypothetical protein VM510_00820 [Caulifigura sp.]|jgi:hypothetical protein|nr:hypothetical protein [Caulifigura sp.]
MSFSSATLALLFLCCGCGEASKPWDKVYPVSGVVTHKGKPIKDAELTLFPVDDKVPEAVRPWAKSSENGEFSLSTYDRGDGAPPGKYKASIVHHEIVVSAGAMGTKPNDLPKKYASRETTDWIIEVKEGETKLPTFDLK